MKRTRPAGDAVARVVAHVRGALLEGSLAPGQRLVEADLARDSGAGRGSVREALRRLDAEGTVTLERHRGASIRKLTRADVVALYDVREVVEGLAARLAASKGLGKAIAAAHDSARRAGEKGDAAGYARANAAFHQAILAAAGHPLLPDLVERLRLPVLRVQFRALLGVETIARSQADHARIVAALRARDPAKAEAAMRAHIRRSANVVAELPDSVFG
ncbi:MAG: GntR family transcriptional regulator [Tagaea sp.]